MSNQEPNNSGIPFQEYCEPNQQSRDTVNYEISQFSDLGSWLQSAESCPEFPTTEPAIYSDDLNWFSSFELPSAQKAASTGQFLSTKEILNSLDMGESSGTRRKYIADFKEMQPNESQLKKDRCKEDPEPSGECRQRKRARSAEEHNHTERLRRQRLKEKMKTLQDLIPNCNKRDKSSTLDDAIKYIRTLQHHVQTMSMGAGFTMFHSSWMMPQQEGVLIPNIPPFIGTTITSGFTMGPLALTCPVSTSLCGTTGLAALSEAPSFQNPGGPMLATSATSASNEAMGSPSFGTQWEMIRASQGVPSTRVMTAEDGFISRPGKLK